MVQVVRKLTVPERNTQGQNETSSLDVRASDFLQGKKKIGWIIGAKKLRIALKLPSCTRKHNRSYSFPVFSPQLPGLPVFSLFLFYHLPFYQLFQSQFFGHPFCYVYKPLRVSLSLLSFYPTALHITKPVVNTCQNIPPLPNSTSFTKPRS